MNTSFFKTGHSKVQTRVGSRQQRNHRDSREASERVPAEGKPAQQPASGAKQTEQQRAAQFSGAKCGTCDAECE